MFDLPVVRLTEFNGVKLKSSVDPIQVKNMNADSLKAEATRLGEHLKAKHGLDLCHSHRLHAIAAAKGYANWNTLLAVTQNAPDEQAAQKRPDGPTAHPVAPFARNAIASSGYADLATNIDASEMASISMEDAQLSLSPARLADWLLCRAVKSGFSDLHLDIGEHAATFRGRAAGKMEAIGALPVEVATRVASVLQVLAGLAPVVTEATQGGRFAFAVDERRYTARLTVSVMSGGTTCVVRILDHTATPKRLDDLHLDQESLATLRKALERKSGLILLSGPTGSGLSTTLCAMLAGIDPGESKIVTVDGDSGFQLPGATAVAARGGGDHARELLRSILRGDPDVVAVGDLRDSAIARAAFDAARTGHLVIATIHAQTAVGAIARLRDLGVSANDLADHLVAVHSQRLVSALCPKCAESYEPTVNELQALSTAGVVIPAGYHPRRIGKSWCPSCNGRGTKGRWPVVESFLVSEPLHRMLAESASADNIRSLLRAQGVRTQRQSALRLFAQGVVSFDDVASL